jgi:hypothetical protein
MRVIIGDASILVDLARVHVVEALLRLPYEFVVPDVMFADELLDIGFGDRDTLFTWGLREGTLDDDGISRALSYASSYAMLSTNESFALALAKTTPNSVMLTCNRAVWTIAQQCRIEVRDLLWVTDEISRHDTISVLRLHQALVALGNSPLAWTPQQELHRAIDYVAKFLSPAGADTANCNPSPTVP